MKRSATNIQFLNSVIDTNSVIEVTVKTEMVTLDKYVNSSRFKKMCQLTTKYILSTDS